MCVGGGGVCVCQTGQFFFSFPPAFIYLTLHSSLCIYKQAYISHFSAPACATETGNLIRTAGHTPGDAGTGQAVFWGRSNAFSLTSPLISNARLFLTCLLLRCCSSSSPLSLSGCEVSGCPLPAQRPVPSAGGEDSARALCGEATGLAPAGCLKPSALCRVSDEPIPSLDEQFPGQEVPRGWAVSVRTPPGKVPGRALLPWGAPYSPG